MTNAQSKWTSEDDLAVRFSRDLALDVLSKSKSGHPGATLSLMPIFYAMYAKILIHNPEYPEWASRDKLLVSCGHTSLALYVQLHLSGYKVSTEDLYKFRTLGSNTPGHPEFGLTSGVEVSTGPLGQGFAMGVGVALSQKMNPPANHLINSDPHTYIILSDGDIQEGISHEAAALASVYHLDNLVAIYDSNNITIDGIASFPTANNTRAIFESQGWNVLSVEKAETGDIDVEKFIDLITNPSKNSSPTLIIIESEIGWPAPYTKGKSSIHGNMLTKEETDATRELLNLSRSEINEIGASVRKQYRKQIADRVNDTGQKSEPISNYDSDLLKSELSKINFPSSISARKANGMIINHLQGTFPLLVGGSADLTESNSLSLDNQFLPISKVHPEVAGSNLRFGVREHAMAAIINGLALDSEILSFCATYLVFADYQKPAIRLAAMMKIPSIFVWTHDSIAIGADGPTHQPIEQLAMLRATPNFMVARPASADELLSIWGVILERRGPIGLALSRQDLPNLISKREAAQDAKFGAYTYHENFIGGTPDVIVIATGSEVELAYKTSLRTELSHLKVRVVSMPSQEIFLAQTDDYKERILPNKVTRRLSVEAASTFGWGQFIGSGKSVGIDTFGLSAPGEELLNHFNFTEEHLLTTILSEF